MRCSRRGQLQPLRVSFASFAAAAAIQPQLPSLDQALPEALLDELAVQVLADEHHLGHLEGFWRKTRIQSDR